MHPEAMPATGLTVVVPHDSPTLEYVAIEHFECPVPS